MKEAVFETGGMLFMFVTLGKFLEAYAMVKTASALQMLMELQPEMALKVTNMEYSFEGGPVDPSSLQTESISASDVRVGDTCTYFLEVGSLRMEFYWPHLP